jgi:hypothetical protein
MLIPLFVVITFDVEAVEDAMDTGARTRLATTTTVSPE